MPQKQLLVLAGVAALILIGAIALFVIPSPGEAPTGDEVPVVNDNGLDTQDIAEPEKMVSYSCKENKTVTAGYSQAQVQIALSDGRQYTLEQTIAASGIRFANEGEEVVFWSKGPTAFVEEDGVVTYADCAERAPETEGMMIDGTPAGDLDADMVGGSAEGQLQVQ